jgi:hypothetical protein
MVCLILLCIVFKEEFELRPHDQLSKYVGPLGLLPTQTVKGGGQRPYLIRGPTQIDQNSHDLVPRYVGPLEMP